MPISQIYVYHCDLCPMSQNAGDKLDKPPLGWAMVRIRNADGITQALDRFFCERCCVALRAALCPKTIPSGEDCKNYPG